MINIFNLFLFLYIFWLILLLINDIFSSFLLIFGVFVALFVSILARKIKIINKDINFLFLNFGFYKHFLLIYFLSLFRYLILLPRILFIDGKDNSDIIKISVKKLLNKQELLLFISTINMLPAISYVNKKNKEIIIYCAIKELFNEDEIIKIYDNIYKINDDSLI